MDPAPAVPLSPAPNARPPRCPKCQKPLPAGAHELEALAACPHCARALTVAVFSGYQRPVARGASAVPATAGLDASCFFHAGRKAAAACDRCGRFLCAVCDLELEGRHWCAACLEAGRAAGTIAPLEHQRLRWDLAVWYLLAGSLVLCWPALLITAPVALGLAGWKLRAPPSRVARSGLGLKLAFPVGLLLLGGLAALAVAIFVSS